MPSCSASKDQRLRCARNCLDRVLRDRVVLGDRGCVVDRLDAVGLELHAAGLLAISLPGPTVMVPGTGLHVDAERLVSGRRTVRGHADSIARD